MDIRQGGGKLYRSGSEKLVSAIDYKIYEDLTTEPARWWGEFYLDTNMNIKEDNGYVVELEDGRRGRCYVKRLSNRVLRGIPSRYMYRLTSISPLASVECKGEGDKGGEVD